MRILIVLLTVAALGLTGTSAFGQQIHREKSLYRNIVVTESNGLRCLLFTVKRADRSQSCLDLADPQRLVFAYTRMTLGGLLLNPNPRRILMIGLGGGSLPVALSELYPEAVIDVVEIDEAVVRVAEQFFDFAETDQIKVKVADARVFIKRAGLRKQQYDLVFLDAFTGDYIPEHLMTQEFLTEARDILTDDGVLVANTFSTSDLYDHESATYQSVFGDYLNFKLPTTGNRVIIAAKTGLPSDFAIKNRASRMSDHLLPYGLVLRTYPEQMSRDKDWDENKRVLTDQYSPANLLRND